MSINVYDNDELGQVLRQVVPPPIVAAMLQDVGKGDDTNLRKVLQSWLSHEWARRLVSSMTAEDAE